MRSAGSVVATVGSGSSRCGSTRCTSTPGRRACGRRRWPWPCRWASRPACCGALLGHGARPRDCRVPRSAARIVVATVVIIGGGHRQRPIIYGPGERHGARSLSPRPRRDGGRRWSTPTCASTPADLDQRRSRMGVDPVLAGRPRDEQRDSSSTSSNASAPGTLPDHPNRCRSHGTWKTLLRVQDGRTHDGRPDLPARRSGHRSRGAARRRVARPGRSSRKSPSCSGSGTSITRPGCSVPRRWSCSCAPCADHRAGLGSGPDQQVHAGAGGHRHPRGRDGDHESGERPGRRRTSPITRCCWRFPRSSRRSWWSAWSSTWRSGTARRKRPRTTEERETRRRLRKTRRIR